MAADLDAAFGGMNLGPVEYIEIPVAIFNACKRPQDPDHENLGENTLLNFCVQSDINPNGVVRGNRLLRQVGGRFLFSLCVKVWLNSDDDNANNHFVEGWPSGGNTGRQVQVLADLRPDGFHYIGEVPPDNSRAKNHYLPVGNNNNVHNLELKNAIMRFH